MMYDFLIISLISIIIMTPIAVFLIINRERSSEFTQISLIIGTVGAILVFLLYYLTINLTEIYLQ